VTYLECRQGGRTIWIGPFAKSLDARTWLLRHEAPYAIRGLHIHERRRAKVLYAAYRNDESSHCVGVFENTEAALAAAGTNGIVIDWRAADCLAADDPLPLQRPVTPPAPPPRAPQANVDVDASVE
jgi:hypothetical protein